MTTQERQNILVDFLPIFRKYLDREVVLSIKYASIRRSTYNRSEYILLLGISNINYKSIIASFSAHILSNIQFVKTTGNLNECKEIPLHRISFFEYDLVKKAEKDAEKLEYKRLEQEWYADPWSFFIKTDQPNQAFEDKLILNGYVLPFEKSSLYSKLICRIFLEEYDFIAPADRYNKIYKYIKEDCYSARYLDDADTIKKLRKVLRPSQHIGYIEVNAWNRDCIKDISMATYNKYLKQYEEST
jgi:hypothetical protein